MKNYFINLIQSLAALVMLFSSQTAYSAGEVHFGTIFVEDLEYDNSDDNAYINNFTDASNKQQELENLYKDIKTANKTAREFSRTGQRGPASVGSKPTAQTPMAKKSKNGNSHGQDKKMGVLKNADLKKRINYFIELRTFAGNQNVGVYQFSPSVPS